MSDNESKIVSLSGARDKDKPQEKSDKQDNQQPTYCSFCGRPNHLVIKMIKGPGVSICSECVMICIQYFILEDKLPSHEAKKILDTFWMKSKK